MIIFCKIGSILDFVDPFALAIQQVLSVKHTLVPLYNCRNFTPLDPNQIRSDVCEVAGRSKDSEAPKPCPFQSGLIRRNFLTALD